MKKDAQKLKAQFEEQRRRFYASFQRNEGKILDDRFAREDDEPLTDKEIREIDKYWGKYSFAYPQIDYKSFQTYKNRFGEFDVRHCPGNVEYGFFFKAWEKTPWAIPFQNKAMLPILYSNVHQPRTLVRRMKDILYNEDYQPISVHEAEDILLDFLREDKSHGIICKPNGRNGGHGIEFLRQENANRQNVRAVIAAMGERAFVAQELMRQSPAMARFNPSSVNTVRMTSLVWYGKVHILSAIVRIGASGSTVDNFCSGGSLLGMDPKTGVLNHWAMDQNKGKITVLPSGVDLSQKLSVPNYQGVVEAVKSMHYRVPYIRMIAWDIALDENDTPTLIECNFAGYYQMSEFNSGAIFKEHLDGMLDQWLVKLFSLPLATDSFVCDEYAKHIVIREYIGESTNVEIPKEINGKPVTGIDKNAFKGYQIETVSAPVKLLAQAQKAAGLA